MGRPGDRLRRAPRFLRGRDLRGGQDPLRRSGAEHTGGNPDQPSLTRKKMRRLEITAGAPKNTRRSTGVWSTNQLMRTAERELAEQAEASYQRMVKDQQAGASAKRVKIGASATPERASIGHSNEDKAARRTKGS